MQVYIDGISQLSGSFSLEKPAKLQVLPDTPDWDKEKNAPELDDEIGSAIRLTQNGQIVNPRLLGN